MVHRTSAKSPSSVADALHSAAIHLLRKIRKEDERTGITASRLSALSVLVFGGPMRVTDLARAEHVKPPTMTRIVAALVEAGLVVREPDPADGRVAWVRVTPEGRRLLERSRRRKEAYLAKALRSLEPEDLRTLEAAAEILERLTDAPFGARAGARS